MSHVNSMMTYGESCTHTHLCNTHTLVQGHGFLSYGPSNSVADLLHGDILDTYTLPVVFLHVTFKCLAALKHFATAPCRTFVNFMW